MFNVYTDAYTEIPIIKFIDLLIQNLYPQFTWYNITVYVITRLKDVLNSLNHLQLNHIIFESKARCIIFPKQNYTI